MLPYFITPSRVWYLFNADAKQKRGAQPNITTGERVMNNEFELIGELEIDRRGGERNDRRAGNDRRRAGVPITTTTTFTGPERREGTRREKVERRRQIDPTTCERDYSADEIEFMKAMDDYKRKSGRQFPTWSEVLEVVRSLGYKRD